MFLFLTLNFFLSKKEKVFLEQLYKDQSKIMWYIALKILKDKELAEDVVQEAFIKLIKKVALLTSFEDADKVNGYVFIVTKNTAFKAYNKDKKINCIDIESIDYSLHEINNNTENIVILHTDLAEIKEVIDNLSPIHKDAVYLRYLLGTDYKEIADILNVTIGTARERVSQGLKRVRATVIEKRGDV